MFNKEYSFKGTHAQKVIVLTAKFNEKTAIFKTNIDVFINAAVVGYLYKKKSSPNNEKNTDGKSVTTKIFIDAFNSHQTDLYFAYRLVILSDKTNESKFEERLNKAFRYFYEDNSASDFELFEQYVLGGIDILYEKLIIGAKTHSDYVLKLYEFINELHERYIEEESDNMDLGEQLIKIARR